VIAQVLRPEFEVAVTPSDLRRHRERELKQFTEEQFAALDAMESNPRVVFEGAAGTGKTFLALEVARRASVKQERVLLVCFNAMLGEWLRRETASLAPHVTARTIHSYMLATAQVPPADGGGGSAFWESELPGLALQQIVESSSFEPYDVLIVDETQDILRSDYLDVLDLSLKGGLAAGTVRLFGDFERQAIFEAANVALEEYCESRGGHPARFRLSVNCRNTPRIVELIKLLGRVPDSYSRVLRPDTGSEPRMKFSATGEAQCELLAEALEELYDSGLTGSEIAVISPIGHGSCAERIGIAPWPDRLAPAREAGAGQIPYTTVQAFKGMEAPAVVVTDVASLSTSAMESLFYTAITRATDRLVILLDEGARATLRTLLER
jgi:ATP:corrinoid adenosyltransferase